MGISLSWIGNDALIFYGHKGIPYVAYVDYFGNDEGRLLRKYRASKVVICHAG